MHCRNWHVQQRSDRDAGGAGQSDARGDAGGLAGGLSSERSLAHGLNATVGSENDLLNLAEKPL